jgi:hypothetical protein
MNSPLNHHEITIFLTFLGAVMVTVTPSLRRQGQADQVVFRPHLGAAGAVDGKTNA